MPNNDKIYGILIDYIREDNKWKESMTATVSSIETQTKLTNGRLNKLEPIVETLDKANDKTIISNAAKQAVQTLNWKWITGIGAVAMFIINFLVRFLYDVISKHISR